MNRKSKQGSGLFVVLIVATVLGIGVYSVMDLVLGEFKRNKKSNVYHEAKQAAETILQSSLADLKTRFEAQTAFPTDDLSPSSNPLYISDELVDKFAATDSGSSLVIPEIKKYTSTDDFNSQETEVIGGQIPPGEWRYVDPLEPGNEEDELKGKRVFERNIEMVSKATVRKSQIGESTVYARQFLLVRDAPLFAYAIFYNLPMEIAPGPKMEVHGNIHVNNDAWFQSSAGLDIYSQVTIAGDLHHGRHEDSGLSDSSGAVRIENGSNELVNMMEDDSWPTDSSDAFDGTWLESSEDNFADIADQIWDFNLQTGDHGVSTQNPVGVSDYIEDIDPDTDAKESFNSAYPIIQPTLSESELTIPDQSTDPTGYEEAVALNEVEQQKYAYKAGLTIKVDSSGNIDYVTYDRNGDGEIIYTDGEPTEIALTPSEDFAVYESFSESSDVVTSGLHDKRQADDLDIVELDVGALKDLIHADDADDWGGNAPSSWWNGVVYIEFPQENTTSTRDDDVNPAVEGQAVKLTNGDVIPNPSFGHDDGIYGSSFATNQALYIEGDYNSDGDRDTGSPTEPDDPDNYGKEGHEAPSAIVADSVTFLSENWDDGNSAESMGSRIALDTEVSAAILTGLVPSGESGSNRYSGGVENFPRFLENWAGKNLRIRGSLVALFESEVGTRAWGYGDVYSPPARDWGFHSKFAEGYLPPGTPNARSYRGIDFELISADEYAEHIARIKTYF